MALPKEFNFSQGNLQDFLECRRRFYLRYILKLRWPAIQTEPILQNEQMIRQGEAFHQRVQQFLLGIPPDQLLPGLDEEQPLLWWHNFLQNGTKLAGITGKDTKRYAEQILAGTIEGFRLIAKYDLITVQENGKIIIYDWKTSQKKPRRTWLGNRIQTILYPYLLVISGKHLSPQSTIQPQNIQMIYWFPAFPNEAEVFKLNKVEFDRSQTQILDLARLITQLSQDGDEKHFPLTDDINRCTYCVFRSLCNRGVKAGSSDEEVEADFQDEQIDFSFDQIGEIVF